MRVEYILSIYSMADATDLLNQFRKVAQEENEPLRKGLEEVRATQQEQGRDIKSVRQDVART
jgi:hypothetical protein